MGRPAKPLAAHKADGTFRADRHSAVDLPVGVPEPGLSLSPRAMAIYEDFAGRLTQLGVLSDLDGLVLTEAAAVAAELEWCREQLATQELIVKRSNGSLTENPLCGVANRLRATLYKYLMQLGMTPRSRTGLRIEPPSDDPLDAFM